MKNPDECPCCDFSFIGAPISEKQKKYYGNHTHFRLEIGIYDMDKDMTIEYECPNCKYRWDRFTGEQVNVSEKL